MNFSTRTIINFLVLGIFVGEQTFSINQATATTLQSAALSELNQNIEKLKTSNDPEAYFLVSKQVEAQLDMNLGNAQEVDHEMQKEFTARDQRKVAKWTKRILRRGHLAEKAYAESVNKMSEEEVQNALSQAEENVLHIGLKPENRYHLAQIQDAFKKKYAPTAGITSQQQLIQNFHEALPRIAEQSATQIVKAGGFVPFLLQAKKQLQGDRETLKTALKNYHSPGQRMVAYNLLEFLLVAILFAGIAVLLLIIGLFFTPVLWYSLYSLGTAVIMLVLFVTVDIGHDANVCCGCNL